MAETQNKNDFSQTNSPFVSVIIPVYKVEQYLNECVDSVLNQTFSDFEVILVDDGSPDRCPAICDEYAAKDTRVKVIHKENGGLSDARNAGINVATGEWLLFVDSDDYLENSQSMEHFVEFIKQNEFNLILQNRTIRENFNQKEIDHCVMTKENFIHGILAKKFGHLTAWSFVVKREFVLKKNLYFVKGILHEDEEWMPRTICSLNHDEKIGIFNKRFYFYRVMRKGSINTSIKQKNILDKLFIVTKLYEYSLEKSNYIESTLLLTYAAKILTYVILNGKEIYSNDEKIKNKIFDNLFLLKNSKYVKHKILFFVLKIRGIK
ncbi:MAG: glycosyltransferase [Bacteroides sp.]|nr:glycosyltransferase [Prevotella sp.]MCM1407088.1 glycosyltransferase [Treponema brennaborense]MCM1470240.1 glycosyltransferase [Bacteroides sp.]